MHSHVQVGGSCDFPKHDLMIQLTGRGVGAVVVAQGATGNLRGLVRQLSIDQFENEGRRVSHGGGSTDTAARGTPPIRTPLFERTSMDPGSVHKVGCDLLLPQGPFWCLACRQSLPNQ